jgi:hypothetical protein
MVPFASMIACLAAATTLSGVSFGQLIMTDLCGATAMAKVARSATEKVVIAKRILLGIVEEVGRGDYKCGGQRPRFPLSVGRQVFQALRLVNDDILV